MLKVVIVCFVLGLLIPVIARNLSREDAGGAEASANSERKAAVSSKSLRDLSGSRNSDGGVLAMIKDELLRYDGLEERDVELENQLMLAIFGSNKSGLVELRELIGEAENIDRFGGIMSALYARWAELDPAAAWILAQEETLFPKKAREAVLLTWLNSDRERAMEEVLLEKGAENLAIITRYSSILAQHDPSRAADFVDSLFEIWPEADAKIFPQVAKAWAESNPTEAAEWIATHWDRETRNKLLNDIAWSASKFGGQVGLDIVKHIDDPDLQQAARLRALDGWGHAIGGGSLSADAENSTYSIADGLPSDWSDADIQAFSKGFAKNFADLTDELVKRASNEEQKQSVYVGLIKGVVHTEPGKLVGAIENVSLDYLQSPAGQKDVSFFFERWGDQSAEGLNNWLGAQPAGPRTEQLKSILDSANHLP